MHDPLPVRDAMANTRVSGNQVGRQETATRARAREVEGPSSNPARRRDYLSLGVLARQTRVIISAPARHTSQNLVH